MKYTIEITTPEGETFTASVNSVESLVRFAQNFAGVDPQEPTHHHATPNLRGEDEGWIPWQADSIPNGLDIDIDIKMQDGRIHSCNGRFLPATSHSGEWWLYGELVIPIAYRLHKGD
jgi:hypothetical protein